MIEVVVALLMFCKRRDQGSIVFKKTMAACLRASRVAEREFNPESVLQCIRSEAETEIYLGEKSIKKTPPQIKSKMLNLGFLVIKSKKKFII